MKRSKDVIHKITPELPHDKEVIEAVMSFYWSTVVKKINSLDYVRIYINELGDFYVRSKSLRAKIYKQTNYVKKLDKTKFNRYAQYLEAKERLEKLHKMEEILDEQYKRKMEISKKKQDGKTTSED